MGKAAIALARAADYVNAGTVELIAERDDPGSFYFLEVNTRLQVEHPVTEAVTGLDLVELQLRIAAGEPLGFGQEDVRMEGHAVEARLYAEDPAHGFLPSARRVVVYEEPADLSAVPFVPYGTKRNGDSAIRIDSGVDAGTEVGTDYDPMLAKVIAHAGEREEALARLDRALGELVVLGPVTNAAYLRALLARPEVRAGELDTGLIERLGAEIAPPPAAPELAAVALAEIIGPPSSDDPWDARDGWRQTGPAWARARLAGPDGEVGVAIQPAGRQYECRWAENPSISAGIGPPTEGLGGNFRFDGQVLEVDGESRPLRVYRDGGAVWILDGAADPARFLLAEETGGLAAGAGAGSLEAPMPGVVIDVRTAPGAEVAEGDVLVVLESMKMELAVQSPRGGAVAEVLVTKGEQVARGQTLIVLATEEEPG
jgi:acetyl-CoA/propionyl-CoA carboxylase biotin carboxyl carrier protein